MGKRKTEANQSTYFVLNVWEEKLEGRHVEWRGELLHIDTGVALHFEDWPELVEMIAGALDKVRLSQAATGEH